ncbi:hypothetical protein ABEF93_002180 [Exophiala dermatitidis]
MARLTDLPPEILTLLPLSRQSLANMTAVNKEMREVFRPLLYRTVEIYGTVPKNAIDYPALEAWMVPPDINRLYLTLLQEPELWRQVRQLTIAYLKTSVLEQDDRNWMIAELSTLRHLLSCFKTLQHIKFLGDSLQVLPEQPWPILRSALVACFGEGLTTSSLTWLLRLPMMRRLELNAMYGIIPGPKFYQSFQINHGPPRQHDDLIPTGAGTTNILAGVNVTPSDLEQMFDACSSPLKTFVWCTPGRETIARGVGLCARHFVGGELPAPNATFDDAFAKVSTSLENLVLTRDRRDCCYWWKRLFSGSLRGFENLKELRIDATMLIGHASGPHLLLYWRTFHSHVSDDYRHPADLASLLPASLERLGISLCSNELELNRHYCGFISDRLIQAKRDSDLSLPNLNTVMFKEAEDEHAHCYPRDLPWQLARGAASPWRIMSDGPKARDVLWYQRIFAHVGVRMIYFRSFSIISGDFPCREVYEPDQQRTHIPICEPAEETLREWYELRSVCDL